MAILVKRAISRGVFNIALDASIDFLNDQNQDLPGKHGKVVYLGDLPYYPLATTFPVLKTKLRIVQICEYPTPVNALSNLS